MDFFFEQVDHIFTLTDQDPYTVAAYIHCAFVRIHPFGDGNGRIARLISSIPLLRKGLPPIIVSLQNKKKYFKALRFADDNDIRPLAQFLQEESFRAIEELSDYNPSESPPKIAGRRAKDYHGSKRSSRLSG